MEVTIWCPVCGQVITGLLNLETGTVTATCATCGEVTTSLAQ
jgi:uncharacterized Zn finger protein